MKIQILALLVICSTALASPNWWRPRPSPRPGSPCVKSRPQICGNATLVVEQLTGPRFGANVCKRYKQYPVISHVYKQFCYNSTRFGVTRRICSRHLYCESTGRCDSVVNSSAIISCCDGYTTNTSDNGYYYRRRLDCPIKLEDTVVDCINKLGLAAASNLISQEGLQGPLNNQAEQFTLFVPTNEALAELDADEEDDLNALLLSHAIDGKRRAKQLQGGRKIPSLADCRFIQTTSVLQANNRERSHSMSKSHSRSASHSKSSKDYYSKPRLFVNGAEVIRGDACIARNGIVHVIDGVIRSSNESLLSVLSSNPELTKFTALVRKARQERRFNSKKTLLTVFAPEDNSISDHVQDCLCQPENKNALYKFVASHITGGAETNSTITLRSKIFPKFCYYYGYHRRCALEVSVENGKVTIGNSEVTETDIPASNGVLHIISEPFNNPKLNLNKLCPPPPTNVPTGTPTGSGEPPATTSESPATTSESPATTSESPTTTSESPATTSESPATTSESPATTSESPATTSESPATTGPTRPPVEA